MLQDEPYRKPLQPPFQTEADRCLRPAILKTRAVNECAKPRNFAVRITIPWQFHLINISHENPTTNLIAIRFINSQFVFFLMSETVDFIVPITNERTQKSVKTLFLEGLYTAIRIWKTNAKLGYHEVISVLIKWRFTAFLPEVLSYGATSLQKSGKHVISFFTLSDQSSGFNWKISISSFYAANELKSLKLFGLRKDIAHSCYYCCLSVLFTCQNPHGCEGH